jgi:RHS repeat-associated protein
VLKVIQAWFGRAEQNPLSTSVYAIHTDHLGTPQLVTDSRQKIVWNARYTAFGNARVSIQAVTLNLRFPGQYFDGETGTHYNYFRDYDPHTGRYLTSDPIGLAGGINTYLYVKGNSLSAIDPIGLYSLLGRRRAGWAIH